MEIINFLKQTMIDFPDKVACEVFTYGCNYKCSACHAKTIINENSFHSNYAEEEVFSYLDRTGGFIDGMVICGGEPTQQKDLIDFLKKIKDRELAVKLDTNGSNPKVLKELKEKKLVDYIAMDVKAPIYLYQRVIGKDFTNIKKNLKKCIKIVSQFPDYEFRTTIVPIIRNNGKINWMTSKEVKDIGKLIYKCTGNKNHKYFLQRFRTRNNGEIVDKRFSKENLSKEMHQTPDDLMTKMKEAVKGYLPKCEIR